MSAEFKLNRSRKELVNSRGNYALDVLEQSPVEQFQERSRARPPIAMKGGRQGELGILPEWVLQLTVFAVIAAVTAAIFIWLF